MSSLEAHACLFDVFGTCVDWQGSMVKLLSDSSQANQDDWRAFADEWREGYKCKTREIAEGAPGPTNVDDLHRMILEEMLASSQWSSLAPHLNETDRSRMVHMWHELDAWPDASSGLHALKNKMLVATLSNGTVRLLIDLAKRNDLPWDAVFSGSLFDAYKPNPKMYLEAAQHLEVPPSMVCMVAAHIEDLRHAARHGMKTVYVRRPTEDMGQREQIKPKSLGGEVDAVVDSFLQLAALF